MECQNLGVIFSGIKTFKSTLPKISKVDFMKREISFENKTASDSIKRNKIL